MTMTSRTAVLSQYLVDSSSLAPAKKLEDCIVGPCEQERENGAPSWRNNGVGVKRKRTDDDCPHPSTPNNDEGSTLEHAVRVFLSSGCCVIPNVLPIDFVQHCKNKATLDLDLLNRELESQRRQAAAEGNTHKLASAYRVDYREMVDRDGARRDVRFQLDRYPYTAPGLVYNSIVLPLVRELLGEQVNLLYAGVMWARTEKKGTPQKWHADGGHCFDHAHQPPHCINAFFPLIDLTSRHGPTEVQPGSHVLGQFNDSSHASFGLECNAGDAILFDYRLKHRGGINVSDEDRPILYLAYARPWFRDAGNTRSGNSLFPTAQWSPPWVSRLVTGQAMRMMQGFENDCSQSTTSDADNSNILTKPSRQGNQHGSGEQWVLFKMNVQLDGDKEETLVVREGDIATELSTQFCLKHRLSNDFIPVLADTIQQQMNQVKS